MTRDDFNQRLDNFFAKWDDKFIDFDGVYGAQCVDLIKQYFNDIIGIEPKARGNAVAYWDNCPELTQIPNSPTGVPQKGDVIIWNAKIGGGSGHIAIAKGVGDTNKFDSFDQNWPVGSACHFVNHNYTNVIGWLRAKNIDDATAPAPAPQPAADPRDQQITDLTARLAQAQNDLADANNKLADSERLDDTLSLQLKTATDQITSLTADKTALESTVASLTAQLAEIPEPAPVPAPAPAVFDLSTLSDGQKKQIAVKYVVDIFRGIFARR